MKTIIILSLLFSTLNISTAQEKVLLANIEFANHLKSQITNTKVDAGFSLALSMTKKYLPITNEEKRIATEKIYHKEATIKELAEELKVNKLAFLNINSIHNTLRIDLEIKDNDNNTLMQGHGYAYINYRLAKNDEQLFDPAILTAIQRALVLASKDTNLYSHQPEKYQEKYADPLVIGGFIFKESKDLFKWELFKTKVVSSYDAVEVMFEEMSKRKEYAVFDIATRDSMYAHFNLHIIENYNAPGTNELKALESFGIKYYVFGEIERNKQGAKIKIHLAEIFKSKLYIKETVSDNIAVDDIETLRYIIRKTLKKLN